MLKNEHGDVYFHAEWPYDLPQGWNDRTIIAADRDSSGAVFALTPTSGGQMKADPLPLEPRTGPSFGYGYGGGSPYTLYQALIRCALGAPEAPFTLPDADEASSPLWQAITTTQDPSACLGQPSSSGHRQTPPAQATPDFPGGDTGEQAQAFSSAVSYRAAAAGDGRVEQVTGAARPASQPGCRRGAPGPYRSYV